MSELEKLERQNYQRLRNKKILIQTIIIAILTIAFLITSLVYTRMAKDTYVYYTEKGNASYKVYIGDNKFYEEEFLDENHAYIASLVDKIAVDLAYDLDMQTDSVKYKYTYYVDAVLQISDSETEAPLYNPKYELVPTKTMSTEGNKLSIKEHLDIDYHKYNDIVNDFLTTYELKGTMSELIVTLHVNVVGNSEQFANDSNGAYAIELHIPLAKTTFKMETRSTIPGSENSILACENSAKNVFKILSIVFGALDAALVIVLVIFVIMTRDKHIDYARKVKKIVGNYKSYIQKVSGVFNPAGYQVLRLESITEMLEIRDTLQMPILMHENKDKTETLFFIPTNANILYLYEVKVADDE